MLIVEGMPGSGCTRRLGAVVARAPQTTVFPALPSPSGHGGETVVRAELAEDYRRSDIAEHLPDPVLADGCHLGTLARAYVRARLCLEWDTFRRALSLFHLGSACVDEGLDGVDELCRLAWAGPDLA
jgi:hypothetical protein